MSRFNILHVGKKNLPAWINDIIGVALAKARYYTFKNVQHKTTSSRKKVKVLSFTAAFDVDDMINEGCLAYLEALEKPGIKNPPAYARVMARHAMSELAYKEGIAHGLTRGKHGLQVVTGIFAYRNNKGRWGNSAKNVVKTHCKYGHELSGVNVRIMKKKWSSKTWRKCLACQKISGASRIPTEHSRMLHRIRNQRYKTKLKAKKMGVVQGSALLIPADRGTLETEYRPSPM